MSDKPLKDGTDAQVAEYARVNLGLDVADGNSKADTLAAIARAGINVDDHTLPAPRRGRPPKEAEASKPTGRIREVDLATKFVTILINEEDGEADVEPVQVNGRAMIIRRGQESRLPYPYYAALRNAKKLVYANDEEKGLHSPREVPTINFQILEMDPEVRAFEAQRAARRSTA